MVSQPSKLYNWTIYVFASEINPATFFLNLGSVAEICKTGANVPDTVSYQHCRLTPLSPSEQWNSVKGKCLFRKSNKMLLVNTTPIM